MSYQFSFKSCCSSIQVLLLVLCLSACDSGGNGNPSADLTDIEPYIVDAPYSGLLKDCVQPVDDGNYCLLSDLPLLLEDNSQPTVADIMSRVLVSHAWMGDRFQQALETLPPELLQLFAAVTTIVIDDDVRPSYYSPYSGTIYIDPAYLWLDNSEKATINRQPDYRSDFDDELAFVSLARYVDGVDYAWEYYSLEGTEERSLADIRLNLAHLLLHELAHANDFFPPDLVAYLDPGLTIYQAYIELNGQALYRRLREFSPLTSDTLFALADVMYFGDKASAAQKQLTALEVGEAMELDVANDDYAYSGASEDVAMLFEEAMMKILFGIDRDIAYTNRPEGEASCDDYRVAWGERGRIGDTAVKERAQWVVAAIYPARDFSLFFQDLAAPMAMRSDESWCDNLVLF
jgi:hypothetical protein